MNEAVRFANYLITNYSVRGNSKKWHKVKGAFTESFTTEQAYQLYLKQGWLAEPATHSGATCKAEGCQNMSVHDGYCAAHCSCKA